MRLTSDAPIDPVNVVICGHAPVLFVPGPGRCRPWFDVPVGLVGLVRLFQDHVDDLDDLRTRRRRVANRGCRASCVGLRARCGPRTAQRVAEIDDGA